MGTNVSKQEMKREEKSEKVGGGPVRGGCGFLWRKPEVGTKVTTNADCSQHVAGRETWDSRAERGNRRR